jgi:hypothetical protein
LGEVNIEGKAAVGLRVVCKDQKDINVFLDKATGLPLKTEFIFSKGGQDETLEFMLSDYKEFNGAKHFTKVALKQNGKPKEYFDEWFDFAKREKQAIQRGESSFSFNLGLRVCLKILMEFGLIDPKGSVSPSLMHAWATTWLTLIGQIAQMTKTKHLRKHPSSDSSE